MNGEPVGNLHANLSIVGPESVNKCRT
jgi:hypothetical protein